MNISLTPQLEAKVAEKVASGMYHTASEVIREGLRLLFEKEATPVLAPTSTSKDPELDALLADFFNPNKDKC